MKNLFLALLFFFFYCVVVSAAFADGPPIGVVQPGSGGAGANGNFLVLPPAVGIDATLTQGRSLVFSNTFNTVDGGARGSYTVSLNNVSVALGGTGASTQQGAVDAILAYAGLAKGDIIYYNGTHWARLAIGSSGNILTVSSGLPAWSGVGAGVNASAEFYLGAADGTMTNGSVIGNGTGIATITYNAGGTTNIAVDTTVVATTTNSITMTNKTLTSPVIGTSYVLKGSSLNATVNFPGNWNQATTLNVPDPMTVTTTNMCEDQGDFTIAGNWTFTNAPKLSSNTLKSSTGNVITFPNSVDTLVNLGSTQTLSAKTLNNPIFASAGNFTLQQSTANYTVTWNNPGSARAYTITDVGGSANFAMESGAYTNGGIATGDGNKIIFSGAGSSGQVLISGGTAVPTWVTLLPVANGGTGVGTLAADGILYGNGTGAIGVTAVGTATYVLTSNGAGNAPTFQAPAGGGVTSITGTANEITASASTGAVTLSLPAAIDITTANSMTSASSLATVGTIGTGTWQGTTVGVGYGGTGTSYGGIGSGTTTVSGNVTLTSASGPIILCTATATITLPLASTCAGKELYFTTSGNAATMSFLRQGSDTFAGNRTTSTTLLSTTYTTCALVSDGVSDWGIKSMPFRNSSSQGGILYQAAPVGAANWSTPGVTAGAAFLSGAAGAPTVSATVEGVTTTTASTLSVVTASTRQQKLDCTSNAIAVTLPDATVAANKNKTLWFTKIDATTNAVTFNTTSSQTISGLASGAITLAGQWQAMNIYCDGANWILLGNSVHVAQPQDTVMFGGPATTTYRQLMTAVPGTPAVTPTGASGATTYSYKIVATGDRGGLYFDNTASSAVGTTTTGNATLTGSNYNALSWTAVAGATGYAVFRTVGGTVGQIAQVTTTTYNDQASGSVLGTNVPPNEFNYVGEQWLNGNYTLNSNINCAHCRWHINGNFSLAGFTISGNQRNYNVGGALSEAVVLTNGGSNGRVANGAGDAGGGLGGGQGGSSVSGVSASGGGGGGHGAVGGKGGGTTDIGGTGGFAYSIDQGLQGSGGGGGTFVTSGGGIGGNGGDGWYLECTGNVTLGGGGSIVMLGSAGAAAIGVSDGGGGGGSGGTIQIFANGTVTLSGASTLNVAGGNGGNGNGTTGGGGGGGGGIIFIRSGGTLTNTSSTETVSGGSGGTAGTVTAVAGSNGTTDMVGNVMYGVRCAP